MKKKLLATILTGLLLAFTACGSQESPVIPEVTGTAIENTQESVLENAETEDCIAAGDADRDCDNRQSGDYHRGF